MASGSDWYSSYGGVNGMPDNAQSRRDNYNAPKSRFSSNKQADNTQSKPKYTKLNQAGDYIKEQTGLDINKYRDEATKRWDKRTQILVDIKRMSNVDRQKFGEAINQKYSPYTTDAFGDWGALIRLKK